MQINTDAQFVIRCVNNWLSNWLATGWVKSDGEKVINRVQLEELIEAKKGVDVKWVSLQFENLCECFIY